MSTPPPDANPPFDTAMDLLVAAVPPSRFWVRNDDPNFLMFTDDDGDLFVVNEDGTKVRVEV